MRLPIVDGVNVILIAQLVPAATALPQMLVWPKSTLFVPVMTMLVMFNVALPVLVNVTLCVPLVAPTSWLPKLTLFGERDTADAAPVPPRLTECGLPLALSATLSAPVRAPVAALRLRR